MLLSAKDMIINSEVDFLALSKKEKKPRAIIRLLGLAHIKDGTSYREVAKMLKVSLVSVQDWANKFRDFGIEGLIEGLENAGKKRLFPKEKEEALKN